MLTLSRRVRAELLGSDRHSVPRLATLSAVVLIALTGVFASIPAAASAACGNPVQCENQLPGDPPSDWEVAGAGDSTIQGFATSMGVNVGQTENFKINTPSTNYHIDILRLGYYGGDGARLIASGIKPTATLPQTQPACQDQANTGLIDCGNWGVSAQWTVPSTAVSGLYIAHLVRDDSQDKGGDSQILFIVRNDSSHSDILYQTSDETWEAYNDYGGNSLYSCTVDCPPGTPLTYKGAAAVSYNRPFDGTLATDNGDSDPYYAEYQLIYWMEENGYDLSYTDGATVDSTGALLKNHKIFISSAHDEYWSPGQRSNVAAALAAGVNLAFFSGNEMFWKTRWGPSIDGSNTPYRTLTTYKETHYNAQVDPQDPPTWTGAWADPRFSPPADGGHPANAITGQQFLVNSGTLDLKVPGQYAKLRFWRNTAVANLPSGQTATLAPGQGVLGYEWDADEDNGFRPAGEFDMSSTTGSALQTFTDYGSSLNESATATHHLTLYRAPSGALVFGAGTVQWSWGLSNVDAGVGGPDTNDPPDKSMQQATVNLFADMGAQPTTLQSGLVTATQSTDTTPPTSTITSPTAGANLQDNSSATISGTTADTGGGVVAQVDVSTDGGSTWHPATITGADAATVNWSYTWTARSVPTTTIMSRAVDDSGNIEKPSAGVTVNVNCPCSLWGAGETPGTPDSADGSSVTLGTAFTSDSAGSVTGIRFYKASTNTGTHVGGLYSSSGTLLASATFSGESSSGWQQVNFSTAVAISPNTTYIAAYYAPNGHYSDDIDYFETPSPTGGNVLNSPPLHAVPASFTVNNGFYTYGGSLTSPSSSDQDTNYWVDPVFMPNTGVPGAPTAVSATAGNGSVTVSWTAPATGGTATSYTITPYIGTTAQPTTTISGSPPATTATITGLTNGTTYTFTVTATNSSGTGPASAASNPVTPSNSPPGAPTGVVASPASGQAAVSWTAPAATGGSSITSYTVTPYAGSTAGTPVQVSGSTTSANVTGLTNGTAYTFTVTAANANGTGPASPASAAVTPEDTIFDFSTPGTVDSGDASSAELGVNFTASTSGTVNGIRFYKASTNTGTHVGSLWTSTGTLLASGTFTNETASGWQTLTFSSPVGITAGTDYVAGYLAPKGHYSYNTSAFSSGVTNGPLTAVATGSVSTGNGVYAYGSSTTFPSNSYNAANYWVDVLFQPGSGGTSGPPTAPSGLTATPASSEAQVSWTAPSSNGGSSITSYTVTPYAGSTAGTPVQVSGSTTSANVTGLTNGTAYTFTVTAANANGTGPASPASAAVTPEDTIFDFSTPGTVDSGDTSSIELGVNFTASTSGTVNGIRFYKASTNTGTHVGSLWTSTGALLASGTFTNETASGWQTLTFSSPVGITAGTDYVAGYLAPSGHYSDTGSAFSSGGVTNGPLTAVATGSVSTGNGVYAYGSSTTFPSSSSNAANYWVDVLFQPGSGSTSGPPTAPSGLTATPASSEAQVSWTAPSSNGGSSITSYTVTPYAGSTAGTPVKVSGSTTSANVTGLTNGTAYTFTVTAANANGTGPASPASAAVTPEDTIFDFSTPGTLDSGDASSVELGVNFTASTSGTVNGIRFYKASTNTGTHVGSLWTSTGTLLASGTFTNETASGWQTLTFSSPVGITAGTDYVAGYLAPSGHYSYNTSAFSSGVTNGPLTAVATGSVSTGNGVYAYGGSSTFPSSSYNAANYWVDVLFQPGVTSGPGQPTGVVASPASSQAQVSWTPPANQGSSAISGYTVTPWAGSTAGTPVNVSGSNTFTNVTGLQDGTAYTFTVTAINSAGSGQPSAASAPVTPEDTVFDFSTPTNIDSGDTSPVELGVKFTATQSGTVTGVRFYKAATNTGTHIGSLWSSTGTSLASGTFTSETASGWQTLTFSSPVAITAGTTYVAGYLAPNGHYSATPNGFTSGVDNGPLQADANSTSANGVYAYSSSSTFPTSSYSATNYWVDVLFQPGS